MRRIRDRSFLTKTLDAIYGVGPQSAWYMASELFHFYDALDYVSPWEGRIVGRILFGRNVNVKRVQEFLTNRYGEYRLLAFSYMLIDVFWQHKENPLEWLSHLVRR